tara:strand:+ start:28 stop:825 length:798 start_codon:yes stop_codon:yes gene_type:complete
VATNNPHGTFVSDTDHVQSLLRSFDLTQPNDIASMVTDMSMGNMEEEEDEKNDTSAAQHHHPRQQLLCLDVGTKRTGVALSNIEVGVATPVTILQHPSATVAAEEALAVFRQHITVLNELIDTNRVAALVVGWPLELNGTVGHQCGLVEQYMHMLQEQGREMDPNMPLCALDTVVWDERWSSEAVKHAAHQMQVENQPRRKYKRSSIGKKRGNGVEEGHVDDLAATYILQGVLEWLRQDEYDRALTSDGLEGFRPCVKVNVGELV